MMEMASEPEEHATAPSEPLRSLRGLPVAFVAGLRLVCEPVRLGAVVVEEYVRAPRTLTVFAAHVTSLNHVHDRSFVNAFNLAHAAHADGISWSIVAAAGGQEVRKVATSDLAPLIMEGLAGALGRPVRIAVLGGEMRRHAENTVAARAGRTLELSNRVELVQASHGYHLNWRPILEQTRHADPDIILVGMGMPREAYWVRSHLEALPPAIVITCGGWLRILAGEESRAPAWAQRLHLEWAHRIITDPHRTARRYAVGVFNLAYRSSQAVRRQVLRRASNQHDGKSVTTNGARNS